MQKLLTFFSKNISVYAIFNDQTFNDTLINDIVSFEQLSPDFCCPPESDFGSLTTTECTTKNVQSAWLQIESSLGAHAIR